MGLPLFIFLFFFPVETPIHTKITLIALPISILFLYLSAEGSTLPGHLRTSASLGLLSLLSLSALPSLLSLLTSKEPRAGRPLA